MHTVSFICRNLKFLDIEIKLSLQLPQVTLHHLQIPFQLRILLILLRLFRHRLRPHLFQLLLQLLLMIQQRISLSRQHCFLRTQLCQSILLRVHSFSQAAIRTTGRLDASFRLLQAILQCLHEDSCFI